MCKEAEVKSILGGKKTKGLQQLCMHIKEKESKRNEREKGRKYLNDGSILFDISAQFLFS